MKVKANGISIDVEDTAADGMQAGRARRAADHGPGMQWWPGAAFVQALVARAFASCVSTTATSPCRSTSITWAAQLVWEASSTAWGCR